MQESERVLLRLAELDRDQAWLARMLGVHRIQVTRWLSRGIPNGRRREIALVLHKPEDWLMPETPAAGVNHCGEGLLTEETRQFSTI